MIRKGLVYVTASFVLVLLVNLAIALIPPPPVNQNIGIYDTIFSDFNESECRECHSSGLVDRHHLLVPNEGFGCMDCHEVNEGGLNFTRDCLVCHLSSPHHETEAAENLMCSHCHGSLVDDPGDGHEIPTYDKSMVTPDTSYNFINDSSGLKVGGCEACHEPDLSADPAIQSNRETHHNLGELSGNCLVCHMVSDGVLDIRKCEECHGIKSLHSIQYDFDNTTGQLGYGHIGENWDCWGCHGWFDYYSVYPLSDASNVSSMIYGASSVTASEPPFDGPTVPQIESIEPGEITTGQDTTITIYGSNFENTYKGITYTSNVVLDNDLILVPDSITQSEIQVTFPGTLEPANYGLWVVKDGSTSSNKASLNILPELPQFLIVERKVVE